MSNKINATIKVSGGNLGSTEVEVPVEIDFSDATHEELLEWAASNRKIALQRVLRQLSPEELEDYKQNGLKLQSHECGRKIESREDKVRKLTNAGLPRKMAEFVVDNPEEAAEKFGMTED